jgi:hypothetical protein
MEGVWCWQLIWTPKNWLHSTDTVPLSYFVKVAFTPDPVAEGSLKIATVSP